MPEIEDFQYSEEELDAMVRAINDFKKGMMGKDLFSPERGDGFVFGVQKRCRDRLHGLELDVAANRRLIAVAKPFPSFLHRAFDGVLSTRQDRDIYSTPEDELEEETSVEELVTHVKKLGFKGVLTSGGWRDATGNLKTLAEVGRAALLGKKEEEEEEEEEDDRFELIVGGGLRCDNLHKICDAMKDVAQHRDFWLHSSCYDRGYFSDVQARHILREMRMVEAANTAGIP